MTNTAIAPAPPLEPSATRCCDVLVIGAGPAGLAIAAALCDAGLQVQGVAPNEPTAPWANTYGIWCDELEALELTELLSHRWTNCVAYFGPTVTRLPRVYGLLDKEKLQSYFLQRCDRAGMIWHQGMAVDLQHEGDRSHLVTATGQTLTARVIVDAGGHQGIVVQRPQSLSVAYQAAYGIVGRFSAPPIEPGQMVLMDYRTDHLSEGDRAQPPTFLYAMDLGDDVYFMEETSLAYSPAISFEVLESRLQQRLVARGVQVQEVQHVERCLFPMNLPLPYLDQPLVSFGGAASMVHPASGYMVGALLRRAPGVAVAIAQALQAGVNGPGAIAQAAWQALWSPERLRKYYLYRFGLESLMRFDEATLNHFFTTFFSLPVSAWSRFLADTLAPAELVWAMVGMFAKAPNDVRWGLMSAVGDHGLWVGRSIGAYRPQGTI